MTQYTRTLRPWVNALNVVSGSTLILLSLRRKAASSGFFFMYTGISPFYYIPFRHGPLSVKRTLNGNIFTGLLRSSHALQDLTQKLVRLEGGLDIEGGGPFG